MALTRLRDKKLRMAFTVLRSTVHIYADKRQFIYNFSQYNAVLKFNRKSIPYTLLYIFVSSLPHSYRALATILPTLQGCS